MKRFNTTFVKGIFCAAVFLLFASFGQHAGLQDLTSNDDSDKKIIFGERIQTEHFDVVPAKLPRGVRIMKNQSEPVSAAPSAGTTQDETENNNTCATADVLVGTEGKVRATMPIVGAAGVKDEDWFRLNGVPAGSKLYAGTMTSFSGGTTDSVIEVIAPTPDCTTTTVVETDDEDGTFGGSSSSVAGTNLTAGGTYYIRVTNFSTTAALSPIELYYAVRSVAPTAETEPNNNGTPQVIPVSEYVSGVIDPVADTDTFTFTAAAGETIVLSQDLDPERDAVTFNGRIGMGLFGSPTLFLVTGDGGTFDTIDSEAFMITVKTAGTYQVYVDSQVAGGGGPTATYNFNILRIPALTETCTTYTNAVATPIPDAALTTSTINVPTTNLISKVKVDLNINHTSMPDLDIHLRSPGNLNDNGLVTDTGATTQVLMNQTLDDDGAIPPLFAAANNMINKPELSYRLDWFRGENPNGDWNLDIRDDSSTVTTAGTLNSWALTVCDEAAPAGTLIYNQDFEAGDGGFTHSGTADEWERGLPATVAQTVTSPFIAAFSTCASGTNCWKTDLDNTYNISSSQNLVSPTLNLTQYAGTIRLYWQQRYQMESISFDRIYVRITNVNDPLDTRVAWAATNASMGEAVGLGASLGNVPESAGWGRYSADISDFAGKAITVTFHLESDSSVNYGGWAVDDVQLRHVGVVAASVPVGGRVLDANGYPVSRARVTLSSTMPGVEPRTALTNPFGYYRFDDVEVGNNYVLQVTSKRYTFEPRVIFVTEEMTNVDFTASP